MKSYLILAISILFCLQCIKAQTNDTPYSYPVIRGSAEWNKITVYDEFRRISQIPEDIVKTLTTNALLESILNYPLIGDVFVFETFQKGVDKLKENFTAFNSLIQRDDLNDILLRKYEELSSKDITSMTQYSKGENSAKMSFIEVIIVAYNTSRELEGHDDKKLITELLKVLNKKKANPSVYALFSLSTNAWAINRIMQRTSSMRQFAKEEKFIYEGNIFSDAVVDNIAINSANALSK